jgi:hypothetical protein
MTTEEFLRIMNAKIFMIFLGGNMERYKSVVRSKSVNGNRYGFLLQDGVTWVSCFLRRGQNPQFQQAVQQVTQGQEYTFDCERNMKGFLNIKAILLPNYPAFIPEHLPGQQPMGQQQGAVSAPMGQPPVMQPMAVPPVQMGSTVNPLAQGEIPPPLQGPADATVPVDVPVIDREKVKNVNITMQKAHDIAANIMIAIIAKATLPTEEETLNHFMTYVVDKVCEMGNIIADSILADTTETPSAESEFPPQG